MSRAKSSDVPPLIVYFRERRCEHGLSKTALRAQRRALEDLTLDGHKVVATYADDETLPPDYGWLEERPGLAAALDQAASAKGTNECCHVTILRVDPIGSGDRFDIDAVWQAAQNRGVQVWGLGDTATNNLVAHEYAHAVGTPLPRAIAKRNREARARAAQPEHVMMPSDAPTPIAVLVQPSPDGREARVHLCNGTETPITGRYEELDDGLGRSNSMRHNYRPTIDGTQRFEIDVAPGTCQWLFSFTRGAWRGETDRYRFELQTAGSSMVAELAVEGHRFERGWRELTWHPANQPAGGDLRHSAPYQKKGFQR